MKENDVAAISEQFGIDKEIVQASIDDGTLGQRIKDAMKNDVRYTKDDFESFKTNYKAEVTNSYFADLVEKAKQGDIPQDLYKPVKGAALQQLEREVAKKYNVESYSDVQDLIDKAVKSSANTKGGDEVMARQLEELKQANVTLQQERDNAISEVEQKYRRMAIDKDQKALLNSVPFDFTDVDPKNLDAARNNAQRLLKGVFDQEYSLDYTDEGQLVVKKGDEIIKNEATRAPLPASDVFIKLAKDYNLKLKSPDNGGQGGKSSAGSSGRKYESVQEFEADMEAKGISRTDKEYIKEYRASGLSNIK